MPLLHRNVRLTKPKKNHKQSFLVTENTTYPNADLYNIIVVF